jgi:hypothetical protein
MVILAISERSAHAATVTTASQSNCREFKVVRSNQYAVRPASMKRQRHHTSTVVSSPYNRLRPIPAALSGNAAVASQRLILPAVNAQSCTVSGKVARGRATAARTKNTARNTAAAVVSATAVHPSRCRIAPSRTRSRGHARIANASGTATGTSRRTKNANARIVFSSRTFVVEQRTYFVVCFASIWSLILS